MLEACGLKGHRIGGAQISRKHANFIENAGGATHRGRDRADGGGPPPRAGAVRRRASPRGRVPRRARAAAALRPPAAGARASRTCDARVTVPAVRSQQGVLAPLGGMWRDGAARRCETAVGAVARAAKRRRWPRSAVRSSRVLARRSSRSRAGERPSRQQAAGVARGSRPPGARCSPASPWLVLAGGAYLAARETSIFAVRSDRRRRRARRRPGAGSAGARAVRRHESRRARRRSARCVVSRRSRRS